MFYITNQNNQIIAVDPSLLALLEVKDIDELYKKIALEDISFSSLQENEKVTIVSGKNEKTYTVESHDLSSMLGNITLVQVHPLHVYEETLLPVEDISTFTLEEDNEELPITKDEDELVEELLNLDIDSEEEISLLHDETISIKDSEENKEEGTNEQEISFLLDDTLDQEKDEESTVTEESNDDALFDLITPNEPENAIDEITIAEEGTLEAVEDDQSPIVIDVENISQSIGISTDDYNIFLNEYIDSALSFEKDLQSTQEEKRTRAISTLSHLSNVLHLPLVTEIVTQIGNSTTDDQDKYIESFYATLARLTTSAISIDEEEISSISESDSEIKVDSVDSLNIENMIDLHEEEVQPVEEAESAVITEGFGTINLDDVKPIHFDFQLEQAANDLSLPVELIEEFVHDFIGQAHTETEKMLKAYEKGDLETIQQIGHLLKGTSSNLRINPLSDTLYEIQFCEDSTKLEDMIKLYWGHFLSLETQIKLTSR